MIAGVLGGLQTGPIIAFALAGTISGLILLSADEIENCLDDEDYEDGGS